MLYAEAFELKENEVLLSKVFQAFDTAGKRSAKPNIKLKSSQLIIYQYVNPYLNNKLCHQ